MALEGFFRKKTVLIGVGNVLRGDDGFGPGIVGLLLGTPGLVCIDAGTTPENQIGSAARHRPDAVLIADAVHLGLEAGSCAMLGRNEIVRFSGLGTHDASPALFMERLEEATRAEVSMLAIQPKGLDFGSSLSDPVRGALEELAAFLRSGFSQGATAPAH
jgi:hydrogenase maturation protease HycI